MGSLIIQDKRLEKIVERLICNHVKALNRPYVQKPWAWALYETWKYVDAHEKPREVKDDDTD